MSLFSKLHAKRMIDFLEMLERQIYPELPSQLHTDITGRAMAHLVELKPCTPGTRILDVGCGQGPALELFEKMGTTAVGVTLGEEDIAACRSKGFTVAKMDQSFLDFEDRTFDVVWARHVIEHSIFPLFTLHEYSRVMRDSGMLYLEVPAPDTACHHERNINHYSVLTKSAWTSLLERSGFSIRDFVSYRFRTMAGDDEYYGFYCMKTGHSAGGSSQ